MSMLRSLAGSVAILLALSSAIAASETGLWNMADLDKAPEATWGAQDGLVQEVTYANEPFHGKPTKVFAYYAHPKGDGPFPAVVLVHGGGGKAFRDWAEHWAQRGYAALAMDLAGNGATSRMQDAGPDQGDDEKLKDFHGDEAKDMWTYHAVAAVIRGHSLLRSRPEVDAKRIALTGISWGGYLTCIIAGLDHRFKAAVPVYGCGFLDQDSYWVPGYFAKMDEARRKRWVTLFDPENYLGKVTCPMLFVDGSNDFAYPLDSLRSSFRLVRSPKQMSVKINLKHGHFWTFMEVDTFIDSFLAGGKPLPVLGDAVIAKGRITAPLGSSVPLAKAELCFTTGTGAWQPRTWTTVPAELHPGSASVKIPPDRPFAGYLLVTDERGLCVSTSYVEIAVGH